VVSTVAPVERKPSFNFYIYFYAAPCAATARMGVPRVALMGDVTFVLLCFAAACAVAGLRTGWARCLAIFAHFYYESRHNACLTWNWMNEQPQEYGILVYSK
jgi:hypothetical protein